jgi:hypothetical protein
MPFRRAEVAAADRDLTRVRTAHAAAERAALRAQADRARAATALAELSGLVARRQLNDPRELPARAELAVHRRQAIVGASVVGTTLPELVSNPAVYRRSYDNVLIEQAGRIPAAFTIWAATRADRAVTLAVEPDQSAPTSASNGAPTPPAEHRWMAASLPQLMKLDRVEGVAAHISGLVLD